MAKTQYDAIIRPNERGGFEIAEPNAPACLGVGNYATAKDAYAVAVYNFEPARVKEWKATPRITPKRTLKLRRLCPAKEDV